MLKLKRLGRLCPPRGYNTAAFSTAVTARDGRASFRIALTAMMVRL
jgi:hypothetical protein